MENLFLIGGIQALFFAMLLLGKKAMTFDKKLLVFWFALLGVHLLIRYWLYQNPINVPYGTKAIHLAFPLLHYPVFYMYVKSLVRGLDRIKAIGLSHCIPFFAFIVFYFVFCKERGLVDIVPPAYGPVHFNLVFNLVSGLVYMGLSFILLIKFNASIKQSFSNIEKLNLKWLAHLIVGYSVVLLLGIAYLVIVKGFRVQINISIDAFIYGSISLFIFFVGFFSIKKTLYFSFKETVVQSPAVEPPQNKKNKYGTYGLKQDDVPKLKELLLTYMHEEKPYLDCDLTLAQLAQKLNIYKHYLTQVLNEGINQNFFDFVNAYRVEAVKEMLAKEDANQYTLLGIAYNAGFNSKSSFNRIFKNQTGLTPSQYKKSLS
jgi:AraC-like DNA-binding protein